MRERKMWGLKAWALNMNTHWRPIHLDLKLLVLSPSKHQQFLWCVHCSAHCWHSKSIVGIFAIWFLVARPEKKAKRNFFTRLNPGYRIIICQIFGPNFTNWSHHFIHLMEKIWWTRHPKGKHAQFFFLLSNLKFV